WIRQHIYTGAELQAIVLIQSQIVAGLDAIEANVVIPQEPVIIREDFFHSSGADTEIVPGVLEPGLGERERHFGGNSGPILIVRRVVGVRACGYLRMRGQPGNELFVDVEANPVPSTSILERAGNGIG